jgi:hypothetical protein
MNTIPRENIAEKNTWTDLTYMEIHPSVHDRFCIVPDFLPKIPST